jgi:protein-S-isoprenylcysteine O-methyltransferase Ste14
MGSMPYPDFTIYLLHLLFWLVFMVARFASKGRRRASVTTPPAARPIATIAVAPDRVAPYSRVLVIVHGFAFAVMYFGIGNAVSSGAIAGASTAERSIGAAIIVAGAALAAWALAHFESWRLRAKLDEGHKLATDGPFRLMRHPIYSALNLLALGSAIWVSGPAMWIAFALMMVGGDLRGRAEERLLKKAFGSTYDAYCARTRRFVPFLY